MTQRDGDNWLVENMPRDKPHSKGEVMIHGSSINWGGKPMNEQDELTKDELIPICQKYFKELLGLGTEANPGANLLATIDLIESTKGEK